MNSGRRVGDSAAELPRRLQIGVVIVGFTVALVLAADLWPGLRGPSNWRWPRRPVESVAPLFGCAAVFCVQLLVAFRIRRVRADCGFLVRTALLATATVLVFAQMVLFIATQRNGLANIPKVVLSNQATSYHTIAGEVTDVRDFIRRYHLIQDQMIGHGRSHPPGRVLFFWQVNQWVASPERAEAVLRLGENIGSVPPKRRGVADSLRAGALVAGFLLMGLGSLCLVPLATLLGGRGNAGAAGAGLLLMGIVPSYLIFNPMSDHLVLLISLSAGALIIEALRRADRPSAPVLAFSGGLISGLGAFVSFTTLAAVGAWGMVAVGMIVVAARRSEPIVTPRRATLLMGAGIAGLFVVPALTAGVGMNWPAVFERCMWHANQTQTVHARRIYSTWVGWNLVDFTLFVGPPIAIVMLARARVELSALKTGRIAHRGRPLELPVALAFLVAITILDLSGVIMGEVGRVWLFFTPFVVAAAAKHLSECSNRALLSVAVAQFSVVLTMRAFLRVLPT
jgi:hypothetical protein